MIADYEEQRCVCWAQKTEQSRQVPTSENVNAKNSASTITFSFHAIQMRRLYKILLIVFGR